MCRKKNVRQVNHPCAHCGRAEGGRWFVPCPSDDCPSHDKAKRFKQYTNWNDGHNTGMEFTLEDMFGSEQKSANLIAIYGRDIRAELEKAEIDEAVFWVEPFNGMVVTIRTK